MLDEILERVDRRLDAVGLTAAEACVKAGLSRSFLTLTRRAAGNGSAHGGSVALFGQLAGVLGTTVGWLIDGSGEEEISTFRKAPMASGRVRSASWEEVFASAGSAPTSRLMGMPIEKQFTLALESTRFPELGTQGAILQCISWSPGDPISEGDMILVEKSTVWGKWRRQAVCRAVKSEKGFEAHSLGAGGVSRGALHLSSQKLRDCIYPLGKITHSIRIL